ncbi:MAG: FAD-dependent thymidylate synthase [Candidatus Aenigmatarchaeota archaeon]
MKVKLVAYTPNPELVCAAAAMTSTTDGSVEKNFEEMTIEKAQKLIRNVVGRGHVSIVEHANFTFAVEDVSRSLTHQLVRHRIASYTQQSQRYVKLNADSDWFVVPHTFQTPEQQEKFKQRMAEIAKWYEEAVADEIPAEDARFYLPNAAKTAITVTMNARELLHFFGLRCCARAQWEIKELADAMLAEARKVAPVIFENAGPNCVQLGYCPEGKMKPDTCNLAEIKKKYEEL